MRILVTGGAGFIGSNTAELLLSEGHDVVVLDNLINGRAENVPKGAEFVEGDCGNAGLVSSLGAFEACVHFAGRIEPGESMAHPEVFFANNVGATTQLLEALIESGTPRFVFSSSCAVYGDQLRMPIDESCSINPGSPYGESKRTVEVALHWLSVRGRIRAASLRYFNAAGGTPMHPENHDPEIHLIPIALDVAMGRRPFLEIYGADYPTPDGTNVRDYIHVTDLARAHVLAIDALATSEELVLNLGSGVGYSNHEVVAAVQRITGIKFEVRVTARRAGDPASAVASNRRAQELLGWSLEHSDLDTIITDAWVARKATR